MGIFDSRRADVFTTYHARIVFRSRVMGGTPKDPRIIEGWLRGKAGLTDDAEELRQATLRTLLELGADVRPDMTFAEIVEASEKLAANRNTNGFKRDEDGLYLESRTIKAMIKESTNILFAGDRWGLTSKGPRNFVSERVFVQPDRVHFGCMEPDGVDLFIGHTDGPSGAQSNLTYHEYVERATLEFDVCVAQADDVLTEDEWAQLWLHAQENGLGALRSQGYGRFDIEQWETLEQCTNGFRMTRALELRKAKGKKSSAA